MDCTDSVVIAVIR